MAKRFAISGVLPPRKRKSNGQKAGGGRKNDVMPRYNPQGPFQVRVGKFGDPKNPEALNRALNEMWPNRKMPHKSKGD